MRFLVVLMTAGLAAAQSHPTWWGLASPDATSLVGIHWESLRNSPFGEAVGAELSSSGSLGFPDLACLREARQILISSPDILAVMNGNFPAAAVRQQASAQGFKAARFQNVELWISPGKGMLSLAMITEQILVAGSQTALEGAIERSFVEGGPAGGARAYSALLTRAGRFADTADLWVVTNQLPDPLANIFVPLEIEARSFDGSLSLRGGGLRMQATVNAVSPDLAEDIAATLRESIPGLPLIARGLQVKTTAGFVQLSLDMTGEQFEASLQHPSRAPERTRVKEAPPKEVAAAAKPASAPEPKKPASPQIIRILGLDEGPREIVLQPR